MNKTSEAGREPDGWPLDIVFFGFLVCILFTIELLSFLFDFDGIEEEEDNEELWEVEKNLTQAKSRGIHDGRS